MYRPTIFDFTMFFGTIGFFLTCMFLFIRFVPMIPIFEVKTLLPQSKVDENRVEEHANGKAPVGAAPVPQFGD
jgi:hypothetical protein